MRNLLVMLALVGFSMTVGCGEKAPDPAPPAKPADGTNPTPDPAPMDPAP